MQDRAASRVESQEACYVRRLVKSFEEQVAFIQSFNDPSLFVEGDGETVSAIPIEDPEEEMGSLLVEFCGDLPAYKLVSEEDTAEEQERDLDRRQVSVNFNRCVLLCFIPVCYTTTITLATGSTITFGWFFFG